MSRKADLLGGHAASEHCGGCQVAAMSRVGSAHHVLGIPHLLGQLWHAKGSVLLATSRCQGGEAHHEEVQSGEGDQVDCQLPQISIELTCKSAPC